MNRDRIALWVAYALLAGVTAWTSYATDRHVQDNKDTACIVGVAATSVGLVLSVQVGRNDELTQEQRDLTMDLLQQAVAVLAEECGSVPELTEDLSESG